MRVTEKGRRADGRLAVGSGYRMCRDRLVSDWRFAFGRLVSRRASRRAQMTIHVLPVILYWGYIDA